MASHVIKDLLIVSIFFFIICISNISCLDIAKLEDHIALFWGYEETTVPFFFKVYDEKKNCSTSKIFIGNNVSNILNLSTYINL